MSLLDTDVRNGTGAHCWQDSEERGDQRNEIRHTVRFGMQHDHGETARGHVLLEDQIPIDGDQRVKTGSQHGAHQQPVPVSGPAFRDRVRGREVRTFPQQLARVRTRRRGFGRVCRTSRRRGPREQHLLCEF